MPPSTDTAIPGSFTHGKVGFVCDTKYVDASLPGATNVPYTKFGDSLAASGRLPPLGEAPVSAWVLARLAALCGRRFPFQDGEVCGSDGDDYWLRFLAFSTDGTVRPTGKLTILGGRKGVELLVHAAPPHSAAELHDAFAGALLDSPADVRPIRVVVVYTALEDADHWKHVPFTLGWDGNNYVFNNSPEHTISAEDCE
jgi:hypothetical protein